MKPSGFVPQNKASSMKKALKRQLEESREAKRKHRESSLCELPQTCGGCHFWSGAIAALCKALGLPLNIN